MSRSGEQTRENILANTQALVLQQGFAGTSIDDILAKTGLTRGAFFYHFKSKEDLASALVERYWAGSLTSLEALLARARGLSDDPVEQYLIFLKLMAEAFEAQGKGLEGCLFASYVYELQQFAPDTKALVQKSFAEWQIFIEKALGPLFERKRPGLKVKKQDLSEFLMSVLQGAFVVTKSRGDPQLTTRQIEQYRNYVKLLFS